ncbi:MAG TPA: LodA/GoxA family CTQ-dependent oxidase [Bryobacteraceae bacterium]|nr:LodA/GoxA family CTQ-dependent oxidase [Bryobacteraceae bacterium]
MAWTFKIFPSIGIARLGNCPGDSSSDFYVGPEIPGAVIVPLNGYKDPQGRVRRQAARFRIFGWEDGQFMGEITSAVANILWTVELANTKGAFNQFRGIGHTNGPLRNASIADRSSLKITPGPRSIGPNGKASFNGGQFLSSPVPLGELQTDSAGRLLVLGGFGSSNSPINAPLTTFANNDGWHDDVSDGPVTATVTMHGNTPVQASGAWVICPPTRFAPPITHPISLYDSLLQAAVDRLGLQVPSQPSFTQDVYPILRSQFLTQWVSSKLPNSFYAALQSVIPPPATFAQRDAIFQQFRPPSAPPTEATPHLLPAIWTDYFADATTGGWVNHPLTVTQYNVLQAWRDGNFINDWVGPPAPGTTITPDGLTRAALENCSGGPFFPGIETSFLTRDQYPFVEPFRLDWTKLQAGDLTKQNAVPWQTDFNDCQFQSPLSWWPAARPDNVFTASSNNYVAWDRGVKSGADMVNFWSGLGFLVQSGNAVIEIDRTL